MSKIDTLTGHFLIAMPSLTDDYFSRSVVYIFEHSTDGALGMIVNKSHQIKLGNVFDHLGIVNSDEVVIKLPVIMGGPVGPEHGFIIYKSEKMATKKADKSIEVSASKDMLADISIGKGPKNFIVTLGYAGWTAGQLEKEIARNDWLVAPGNPDIIFNTPLEQRWSKSAKLIGVDISNLSNQVGHA